MCAFLQKKISIKNNENEEEEPTKVRQGGGVREKQANGGQHEAKR